MKFYSRPVHDLDTNLVNERSQFFHQNHIFRQGILVLKGSTHQVDHPFVYQNFSIFLRPVLQVLMVLFQQQQRLLVLVLLTLHLISYIIGFTIKIKKKDLIITIISSIFLTVQVLQLLLHLKYKSIAFLIITPLLLPPQSVQSFLYRNSTITLDLQLHSWQLNRFSMMINTVLGPFCLLLT